MIDQRRVTSLEKENLWQVHELFSSMDVLEPLFQILLPVGAATPASLLVQNLCLCVALTALKNSSSISLNSLATSGENYRMLSYESLINERIQRSSKLKCPP